MVKRRIFAGRTERKTVEGLGTLIPDSADVPMGRARALGLLLVILAVTSLAHRNETRDTVTGAHGPFPAAFAGKSPSTPQNVMNRTLDDGVSLPEDAGLAHGLAVERTETGAQAVNLRTGKEYWRYERGGTDASVLMLKVSERTVVIGYSDQELVGVDLRTGEPLWRTKVWHKRGYQIMGLAGGQVIARTTSGTLGAFDERDGRRLWTATTPDACPNMHINTVYVLPRHLSAIPTSCDGANGGERGLLLGIDNRTGEVLWHQGTLAPESMVRDGERTLIAPDPDRPSTIRLLDVNRQGIFLRAAFPADNWVPVASGSGTVVSATESRGQDDGAYDIRLRSYDTRTGHLAWQLSAPPGLVYGLPKIADGRLYVVRQPKSDDVDASTRTDLLVLDAKSGQLLHTLPLPRPPAADRPYDDEVMVNSVTGGAVNMSRRYRELMIATD